MKQQHLTSFQEGLNLFYLLLNNETELAQKYLKTDQHLIDQFPAFLATHYLQYFSFSYFGKDRLAKLFPANIIERWEQFYLKQHQKQELLTQELVQLAQQLRAEQQPFILLKGQYLSERFFGGRNYRGFSDLDLLIRREALITIDRILQNSGYQLLSGIIFNKEISSYFTHAFDYKKATVKADVHWSLSMHPSYKVDYQRVWQTKKLVQLDNKEFYVLSDEYELLFNLISIIRDIERGAARLKPFVDLYFILKGINSNFDWQQFFNNSKQENTFSVCINVLAIFLDLFRCREQFPLLTALIEREKEYLITANGDNHTLFIATLGAAKNKLWASRVYQCSRLYAGFWWLTSLPFRLAIHRPNKD